VVPSRLALIEKLGVSLTGLPWLGSILPEGGQRLVRANPKRGDDRQRRPQRA